MRKLSALFLLSIGAIFLFSLFFLYVKRIPSLTSDSHKVVSTPRNIFLNEFIAYPYSEGDWLQFNNVHVVHKPSASLQFRLVTFIEDYEAHQRTYDPILFASKRVSEIMKWGEDQTIWPQVLERYQRFADLSYAKYCVEHINSNNFNCTKLRILLNDHEKIYRQKLLEHSDKNFLSNQNKKIDDIFKRYNNVDKPDISYDLSQIENEGEWGIYSVTLDSDELLTDSIPELAFNDKAVPLEPYRNNSFIFGPVQISPETNNFITVALGNDQFGDFISHDENVNFLKDERKQIYVYRSIVGNYVQGKINTVFFHTPPLEKGLKIKFIGIDVTTKKNVEETVFAEKEINATKSPTDTSWTIGLTTKQFTEQYIELESDTELSAEELGKMTIRIKPMYDGRITLTKVGLIPGREPYVSIKSSNGTATVKLYRTTLKEERMYLAQLPEGWKLDDKLYEDDYVTIRMSYFSRKVAQIGIILSALLFLVYLGFQLLKIKYRVFLTFVTHLYSHFIRPFQTLYKILKNNAPLLRIVFLVAMVLGITVDIFLIKAGYDFIVLLLIVILFLLTYLYRIKGNVIFMYSLFFLLLCPFFISIDSIFIAEKLAVWAFMFTVAGSIIWLWEYIHTGIKMRDAKELYTFLLSESFFQKIFLYGAYLKHLCVLLFKKTHRLILRWLNVYFVLPSRSNQDTVMNVLKAFFLAFFLASIVIVILVTLSTISKEIIHQKNLARRASMNPTITRIEPNLGYKSIYVFIRGTKFGSPYTDKVQLMSDLDGDITPHLWSNDTMIVQIPAHWKEGVRTIYIKKQIEWEGKKQIAESNRMKLEVLPITSKVTPKDDLFFQMMQKAPKEVREVNGYE